MKNSGFSQPPVLSSLTAFLESITCTKLDGSVAWLLIQVIVHSPQQGTSNQCRHICPEQLTETPTEIRPKQRPRILESPKWSVGEQNFPDHFSKNKVFPQNGQSGESNTTLSESPLAGFGKYTSCPQNGARKLQIPALHL